MSLFTQFTGNVVDKDNTSLKAYRYKGYHKESDTWSKWYSSNNETQYNFNLGDADWLTQTGVANKNDTIIIVAETLESNIVDRAYSFIVVKLTDDTTYINDIKLIKGTQPLVIDHWVLS